MGSGAEKFFLLLCVSPSLLGDFISRLLTSFLSLMKEKKAKENQGDDRQQFFRVLRMMGSGAEKIFVLSRVSPSLLGDFISRLLTSFLSLMKEKKAKENQGDDRQQFFQVLRMIDSK